MLIKHYLHLIRVHHYIKNILIFIPLFFAGNFFNPPMLYLLLIAFISFSLCSSSVYIFNDMCDLSYDLDHPQKKLRPLAAGLISKSAGIIFAIACLTVGLSLMFSLSVDAAFVLIGYLILNIFYSVYLKRFAIIDISCIAIGFVLRLVIGSIVAHISLSKWIIIIIFLLALFIALGKRKSDFFTIKSKKINIRESLQGYNILFIDSSMTIIASVVIVSYIMYFSEINAASLYQNILGGITMPLVIIGILRYLQLINVYQTESSPVDIFYKDRFIQLIILCWLLCFGLLIY